MQRGALRGAAAAASGSSLRRLSSFDRDAPWLVQDPDGKDPALVQNFINGEFTLEGAVTGRGGIPLRDPSTNKLLSLVPANGQSKGKQVSALDRAVAAARAAYPEWSGTPVQTRQRLLLEYAHFLHKKEVREEIA